MTRVAKNCWWAAALWSVLGVVACSDPSGPVPVAAVAVTAPATTLLVGPGGGQSVQLTATPQREDGAPLSGRTVVWATNAPTVVVVTQTGLVTALAVGTATVTATSESQVGTTQIVVAPVPAASVEIVGTPMSLAQGASQQLIAVVRDSAGNALPGRTVSWATGSPLVATVSDAGVVRGVSSGTATITAMREGKSAARLVSVQLAAGNSVTLVGSGFGAAPGDHMITVRGSAVTASAVTPTSITFPMPCIANGPARIQVTTGAGVVLDTIAEVSAPVRELGVGESVLLPTAVASACNALPMLNVGAKYLVMAYNTSLALNTLVDIELAGSGPFASEPAVRIGPALGRALEARASVEDEIRDAAHAAHMARERALYASLMASGAFREPRPSTRARLVAPPTVGTRRQFYYNFNSCSDSTNTFNAKVIYAGTRAIIWEDTANVLQSSVDAGLAGYYTRLGQIYDTDHHDIVRNGFGDPLRRDALTDDDGRIHMVFTQRLNGTGAAAYVTSCDMSARNTTNRAASNFGEFFYGTVPTTAGSNVNSTAFADGWYYFMGRTVIHEVKHIASLSARIANASPTFEAGWLEEGTARHAEELWARAAIHRVAWKSNSGYGTAASNGLFCDFNPSNATCLANDALRRPSYGMRRQFNEIRPKLLEPWAWSPYGDGTGQSGSVFYQTAWSLVRYVIDRYGTSDNAFLTALTQSTATGMANISAVAGVPVDQLIAQWGLALYTDDLPGVTNPDLQFATWNLRNLYASLNADPAWTARWNTPFPITPTSITAATFVAPRPGLRAGAHAYFEVTTTPGQPQLLHLRGPGNTALSSLVRLAIVRIT